MTAVARPMPPSPARRRPVVVALIVVALFLATEIKGWDPSARIEHDIENLGSGSMMTGGHEVARRDVNGEIVALMEGDADGRLSAMLLAEGGIFPVSWGMISGTTQTATDTLSETRRYDSSGNTAVVTFHVLTDLRPRLLGDVYRSYLYGDVLDPRVVTLRVTDDSGAATTFDIGGSGYVASVNVASQAGVRSAEFLDATGAVVATFARS